MSASHPNTVRALLALTTLFTLQACDREKSHEPDTDLSGGVNLRRFADCTDLRGYMTDAMVETLLRYRYSSWYWYDAEAGGGEDDGGSPTDYTTTNVQEEGVDEPDMVKTDGDYIYLAQNDTFTIVDSWPADETSVVSTLSLEGYPYSMFLWGDTAAVFSYTYEDVFGDGYTYGGTRIDLIDVSDRSAPEILRSIDIEGYFADARLIDGQMYAVLNSYTSLPESVWSLAWDESLGMPAVDGTETEDELAAKADTAREILRPLVADIVDGLPLDELLPLSRDQVTGGAEASAEPLYGCTDLYRPAELSWLSVLDVLHLDLNQDLLSAPLTATGLLADGWVVYASTDNLYVGQTSWYSWWGWGDLDLSTAIHKFTLGDTAEYAGSGEVPGWLLDQFSMSEHDGYLRVATTNVDWWWGTDATDDEEGSRVTVLGQVGDELQTVGEVTGIAPGERIYASRMIEDRGYLVTFEQVDPLFTLDLSDPTDPRVVGELETPGYSAYLHPIDDDHLLAVGMDGTADGTITGLAVNVFDVSDMSAPTLSQHYTLSAGEGETWSYSEALWDHHAFTFHNGVLSIPVYTYSYTGDGGEGGYDWFSGLLVLSVDADTGITELGRVDHADLAGGRDSYAWMRRGLYVEDWLYSVSDVGLKVNELMDPSVEVTSLTF